MRTSLVAKLGILVASASLLLGVTCTQVVAQPDDIPETVLVTGSLLRGVKPPKVDPRTLARLENRALRSTLRGTRFRFAGDDLIGYTFGCDGDWVERGDFAATYGRYFIRNNQYCVRMEVNSSHRFCAKLFRNGAGQLFSDVGSTIAEPLLTEVEVTKLSPACQR